MRFGSSLFASFAMLFAAAPVAAAERVLFVGNSFTFGAGSAVNPYAANLLENIQKRKLAVDRIVPLHGAIAPFAELVKVVGGK